MLLYDLLPHLGPQLTDLGLVRLSVLWQLDELLGEHARAVAQDVALKFGVRVGLDKLQNDGVAGGIDLDFHVLSSHCDRKRERTGYTGVNNFKRMCSPKLMPI